MKDKTFFRWSCFALNFKKLKTWSFIFLFSTSFASLRFASAYTVIKPYPDFNPRELQGGDNAGEFPVQCRGMEKKWTYTDETPLKIRPDIPRQYGQAELKKGDVVEWVGNIFYVQAVPAQVKKAGKSFAAGDLLFLVDQLSPPAKTLHAVYRGKLIDLNKNWDRKDYRVCPEAEFKNRDECTISYDGARFSTGQSEWLIKVRTKSGFVGWVPVDYEPGAKDCVIRNFRGVGSERSTRPAGHR